MDKFSLHNQSLRILGCLQHERHYATAVILFIPPNSHSLEKFPSVNCVEPSFVPTSWFKAALTLSQECHLSRILHVCFLVLFCREDWGQRLAFLQTVFCNWFLCAFT